MALVRGPFDLVWGGNTLANVEEINVDYSVDSDEYKTVQHQTFELDGSTKASVSLTLLASDVAALAVVLPQFHVATGETLSTGETVIDAAGVIDVATADCDESTIFDDLFIHSCANPSQVFRLINARTRLDSIEFDDKVRKVVVKFIGEPDPGEASVQFFGDGAFPVVS